MYNITRGYIEDYLGELSSNENIGASDDFSDMIHVIKTEIVFEEDAPVESFDFGRIEKKVFKELRLDQHDVPVMEFDIVFHDLGFRILIEARRGAMWYYYPYSWGN